MKKSKEKYLDAGIQLLAIVDGQQLTIDRLCAYMKRTKGSFYHFFDSIENYTEELMHYWRDSITVAGIAELLQLNDPQERLLKLSKMVHTLPAKAEDSIRAWSEFNPVVRAVVREVDEQRVSFVKSQYQLLGYDSALAQNIALLKYAVYIGLSEIQPQVSHEKFFELLDFFETLIKNRDHE